MNKQCEIHNEIQAVGIVEGACLCNNCMIESRKLIIQPVKRTQRYAVHYHYYKGVTKITATSYANSETELDAKHAIINRTYKKGINHIFINKIEVV